MPKRRFRITLYEIVGFALIYAVTRALWLAFDLGSTLSFLLTMVGIWALYRLFLPIFSRHE